MTLDLYVDIRSQTLIQSHRNGGKFVVPRQYREQLIPLRVFYVSPNPTGGAANPFTIEDSSAYSSVRVAIGSFANPLAVCNGLTYDVDEDCWSGSALDLNTEELLEAVDAASGGELTSIFETEAYNDDSLIKTQDPVVVKRSVLTSSSGLPTPVTDTLFADQLEISLVASDTLTWLRTGDDTAGHVPLYGAPGILATLTAGYPPPATPGGPLSVDSDAATVGGVAGERYLLRVRFNGTFDEHNYSVGHRKPGDDTHIMREGGTVSPSVADLWYIEVSSPAQRIYLNNGNASPPTAFDYHFRFVADSGATVTLTFAADNSGNAGPYHGTLTLVSASQVGGVAHAQPYDSELAAIAALTSAEDRLPYFTGSGTAALATFTGFMRTLLDDGDQATARTTLGAVGASALANYLPLSGGVLTAASAASVPLVLKGAASQTGNLWEVRNSSNVLHAALVMPEASDPSAGAYIGLKLRLASIGGTYRAELYQSDFTTILHPSAYLHIRSGNTNNKSALVMRMSTDVSWHLSGDDGSGDIYPGYDYTNSRGPRIYAGSRFGFYILGANTKHEWVRDNRVDGNNGRVMLMALTAGADVDVAALSGAGLDLQTGKTLSVGGQQVIGARGAAVADPTGGVVVDAECRTQLAALLARFRVTGGHGAIAD